MTLNLTPRFLLAFVALMFVMHEAHEIVHTSVARLICGAWGERDFNVWGICEGCAEAHPWVLAATFAGPLFTFALIWVGAALLKPTNTNRQKSLGLALVFANMPFARILTATMGGGDEVFGLTKLLHNHALAWAIGLPAILLICAVPLYRAFRTIENRARVALFLLFFLAPTALDLVVVLGGLNSLLEKGVLSQYWILGSPVLVTAWTALVTATFFFTRHSIYLLGTPRYAAATTTA